MTFYSPVNSFLTTYLTVKEIMENSERLLGYDRFGNELYKNDEVGIYNCSGCKKSILIATEVRGWYKDNYVKTGNIHNIQEELKHE